VPERPADARSRRSKVVIALAASGSFCAVIALIVGLWFTGHITYQLALLMLVALLGLYIGLGVLVAVWRFIDTLE
jgi:hypothetical protein